MKCLIFFLMLPHLNPKSLDVVWPEIEAIFNAGRIVSAFIIICLYIYKNRLPSRPVWIMAIMQGWIIFSTFFNDGNIMFCFLRTVSILSVALIIDFFSISPFELLTGVLPCLELALYLNLISVLLYYPQGMYLSKGLYYRCYFLGYRNEFILYVLPAMVVALIYQDVTKKKLRPILVIAAGIASICIVWSATSVCGILVFFITIFVFKTQLKKAITFSSVFICTTLANLLITVFRLMTQVPLIAKFIEIVLRKRITLTGRTYIWDQFGPLFFEAPFIGYGMGVQIRTVVGTYAMHMHNQWFQCVFEGGVPALCLFLLLNITVGVKVSKQSKSFIVNIFLAAFSSLYILFIAEAYSDPILFMVFFLAYHVDKFAAIPPQPVRRLRITVR